MRRAAEDMCKEVDTRSSPRAPARGSVVSLHRLTQNQRGTKLCFALPDFIVVHLAYRVPLLCFDFIDVYQPS